MIIDNQLGFNITSLGATHPDTPPITNQDILKRFPRTAEFSDGFHQKMAEKVHQEFGFNTRYWVSPPWTDLNQSRHITTESMMKDLLAAMPESEKDLDAFVFGSTTNSRFTGSQAAAVLGSLGIKAAAYDIKAGCSTSLASLHHAYALLALGHKKVMVGCAETLSKVIDPSNERTWYGLGDGAAALILETSDTPQFVLEKSFFETDGHHVDLYTTQATFPPTHQQIDEPGYSLRGDESALKDLALTHYSAMLDKLLPTPQDKADITWLIAHQVNKRLIEEIIERFSLQHVELLWHADSVGNLGGSSILYSLARAQNENRFKQAGKLLMMSVGGGLSYATQVLNVNNKAPI